MIGQGQVQVLDPVHNPLQLPLEVKGELGQGRRDSHRCLVCLALLAQWSLAAVFQGKQKHKVRASLLDHIFSSF